jgi:heparosan-N-sulfate-glucuronate 5-epimerase
VTVQVLSPPAAWRRCGTIDPDLLVAEGSTAQMCGFLLARRHGIPLVVNGEDLHADEIRAVPQRITTRLIGPRADGVVAATREQLPQLVMSGYSPSRIRVVRREPAEIEALAAQWAEVLGSFSSSETGPARAEPRSDLKTRAASVVTRRAARHLNSALSRGVGYEVTPPGEFFDDSSIRGYYIDFRAKTTSPSAAAPEQLLPAGLAQLALGWWERSLAGEPGATDAFRRTCAVLEDRAERRDGHLLWPYDIMVRKYPFAWPPYSALSQAQAASVFVRAYLLSGDDHDAELAQRAIRSLVDESFGLVSQTAHGPVLEESSGEPPSHILNGWIYALWGLRDVAVALDDAAAASLYEASLSCLRQTVDRYDVGWWTRYSLYPHTLPDLAKPFYHRLHVHQLGILHHLTGFADFEEIARRWRAYDAPQNVARAVAHKFLFVASGYV